MNKLIDRLIFNIGIFWIIPFISMPSYSGPPPLPSFLSKMVTDNMGQLSILLHPGTADALNGVFVGCGDIDQAHRNLIHSLEKGNAVKARFENIIGKYIVHPNNEYIDENGNGVVVREFEVAETMITQELVVEFLRKNPTLVWNGVDSLWNIPGGDSLGSYRHIKREDCPKEYEEIDVGEGEKEIEVEVDGKKVKKKERNLVPICRGYAANYLSKEDQDELAGKMNEVAKNILYREKEIKPGNQEGQEYTYQYAVPARAQEGYYIRSMNPETQEVTTTQYSFGDDVGELKKHAVYWDTATHPNQPEQSFYKLKTKLPNPMGLYDTHGTLWEVTTTKTQEGSSLLAGAGSWMFDAESVLSAHVGYVGPGERSVEVGGRLVRTKVYKKVEKPTVAKE